MKSLIKKFIVFCMLLGIQNLSFAYGAAGRGGMRGGQAFHGDQGRSNFQHQGGNFNRGNFNRGNFSGNTVNRNNNFYGHGGNYYGRGYYGLGGVGAGLGTAALIGAESEPSYVPYPVTTYPDNYSQQQQINQLQQEVTDLENR